MTMRPFYFQDLPVYRLDEKSYYDEFESSGFRDMINRNRQFYEQNPSEESSTRQALLNQFGGVWEYNAITGYIRLYIQSTQIRGQYYENPPRKKRNKLFQYKTHKLASEIDITPNKSNEEIFSLILTYIQDCQKVIDKKYRNRKMSPIIDSTEFENIGTYIDWNRLLTDTALQKPSLEESILG